MLRVQPKSWWSEVYRVSEDGREVTEVNIRWMREAGTFAIGPDRFQVGREGWMSGDFYVARGGTRLASASKPSALYRRFEVRVQGQSYTLAPRSAFTRTFDLARGGHSVGSVRPEAWWSRKATAHLPEDLPLEVRVFLVWLVLVMWKRSRDSAASSGG